MFVHTGSEVVAVIASCNNRHFASNTDSRRGMVPTTTHEYNYSGIYRVA